MPGLGWTGDDFCGFSGVTCGVASVSVTVPGVGVSGVLPEMPGGVDYAQVMLTSVDASAMGPRLSGSLPASWSSLTQLTSLRFADADLSSSLPPEWSALSSLTSLWVRNCPKMVGGLPESWSALSMLQSLTVFGCFVTGELPASWSSMTQLNMIELSNTTLTGTLPPEWSVMPSLEYVWLQNTSLVGPLPGS
ncbi:hypothetical protein NESM_000880100 [Novymonas esmeraldas]|uniref:GP46-like surface antigen n=1 Tax=Novymonas esmeraldas TaxID=1808958 RepID=A0AAW0F1N8_9TRYP